MAIIQDSGNNPTIKGFERRQDRYKERNDAVRRWSEFYYVEDKYKEDGIETLATPFSRNAVDMGIYILSSNAHIDRIPGTAQDRVVRDQNNSGERVVAGNWRVVDFESVVQRGRAWHQRLLASWLMMAGWYAQFTAMVPGPNGEPVPVADLWDPTTVYPEWGGFRGHLIAVDHEFFYSLGSLREMAFFNKWNAPDLSGDDDEIVKVLDHWEERFNREDPNKPEILNSVYVSARSIPDDGLSVWGSVRSGWLTLQAPMNRRTDSKGGGFDEIPILVGPSGGVELASSYVRSASKELAKLGQGLLAPLEEVQDAINRQMSTLLQTLDAAIVAQMSPVVTSPSGSETVRPDDMGKTKQVRTGTEIAYPHAFTPQLSAHQIVMGFLQDMFQQSSSPWVNRVPINASGVALKNVENAAMANLSPHHRIMEHIYGHTGRIWLKQYKQRWGEKSRSGRVRLQGSVRGGGHSEFFDEEFGPGDVPEAAYFISEIRPALVQDDMMKVQIARALVGPTVQLASATYAREHTLGIQDEMLEARRVGEDMVENSPVKQNVNLWRLLRDEADAAIQRGDMIEAQALAFGAMQLLQSLIPQQGRGIAEQPGQGSPESGGMFGNQGGGEPSLSPANQQIPLALPEAPAGPGTLAQAQRNV